MPVHEFGYLKAVAGHSAPNVPTSLCAYTDSVDLRNAVLDPLALPIKGDVAAEPADT